MAIAGSNLNNSDFLLEHRSKRYEFRSLFLPVVSLTELSEITISACVDLLVLRQKQCVSRTAADLRNCSVLKLFNKHRRTFHGRLMPEPKCSLNSLAPRIALASAGHSNSVMIPAGYLSDHGSKQCLNELQRE